jgi:uncharacterized membrane protein YcaP (DUF421 family)
MELFPTNWASIFAPETSLFELIARGSLLYFGILIMMRFMPRRTGGELATMDLIFIVLIAESAAHALGDYTSITEGMVLIGVLMAWNYLVNALSYRVPFIERLVSAPPLQVIRDGKLLRHNMRRELLTEEELMGQLRQQGMDNLCEIKTAFVEGDGQISIIKRHKNSN